MSKVLKINLDSQREIKQEGVQDKSFNKSSNLVPVGKIKTNFFLPELKLDSLNNSTEEISPPVQKVVTRINKFIENIADDYFLLGLHLISLHSLLKESKLSTDQIKSWYAENVNMPYSSAMQCRKVAEVYSDNPDLIGRYSASGAYLLSSCDTPEEREEIWQKAKGDKSSATIRELRETLKITREGKTFIKSKLDQVNKEKSNLSSKKFISPRKIRKSLEKIMFNSENFIANQKTKDEFKTRKILLNSVKNFLSYLDEKL